jgi:hypothetical protein
MTDCPIADKVPHSGRSWRELVLSLAAWNTCGLSAERLQYVLDDLKQDVTVLSELHGAHTSRACSQFVTCGDPEAGPGGWSRNSAVKKGSRVSFRLRLHWFTDRVGEDERLDV